jgi:hypothetical protein
MDVATWTNWARFLLPSTFEDFEAFYEYLVLTVLEIYFLG